MSNEPTPETESWSGWGIGGLQVVPASFARKLERERDEALSELEFRRDLFKLQEQQLNDVRAERDEARETAERYRLEANAMMMQRDRLAEALQFATAYPLSESWYKTAIDALATLKP